jgi:hypothetical protein
MASAHTPPFFLRLWQHSYKYGCALLLRHRYGLRPVAAIQAGLEGLLRMVSMVFIGIEPSLALAFLPTR